MVSAGVGTPILGPLPAGCPVKLSALLPVGQVLVPMTATSKDVAIRELLALLPLDGEEERSLVYASVMQRETELSTGIGRGVAIPHGKTTAVSRHVCAFGVARHPVDFGAMDGLPCRIFFLCVSNPKQSLEHVRVLAQVARVLNNQVARQALENATTAEDVRRVFLDDEQREGL